MSGRLLSFTHFLRNPNPVCRPPAGPLPALPWPWGKETTRVDQTRKDGRGPSRICDEISVALCQAPDRNNLLGYWLGALVNTTLAPKHTTMVQKSEPPAGQVPTLTAMLGRAATGLLSSRPPSCCGAQEAHRRQKCQARLSKDLRPRLGLAGPRQPPPPGSPRAFGTP